ncbi:MAG TPA: divalent cation tolerance protein CutA [Candidatus Faecenecus gallistercoris]|uniref:Divalent cation tolerance protein CutA n=1 Tax=Candidatus Faecenecus gallistercoris TaxID=2840793 RepID=A0A9D0Z1D2_9FIRM|nr:divalent cation tolerance protein CutA [Candidatus Faecenecus gallistercoris]
MCESTYWWQGNIETATEYHLECVLKKSLYPEIEKTFVFFTIMRLLKFRIIKESAEFLNWIQSETTN